MPTLPLPHHACTTARSFGSDAERYHRTRPAYPSELLRRITDGIAPGRALDVGIGSGRAARALRPLGWDVLGVDADARMTALAQRDDFEVEVARFEDWDPAGRVFDLVTAGMTWHWIDPRAGATQAARILRPGGRLATFWNIARPPTELAAAFTAVYRRVVPDTPQAHMPADALTAYGPILATTVGAIEATGAFTELRRHRVDWRRRYTAEEWLDQVPTFGGHSRLPAATLTRLLDAIATVIRDAGGWFTADYAAIAITAERTDQRP